MAFDFIKTLFMSKEEKAKISHIKALIATALADGKVDEAEKAMLAVVAAKEGISDEKLKSILDGKSNVKFTAPEDEETKLEYLKDMVTMMLIDANLNEQELKLCVSAGKAYGIPDEKIKEVLNEGVQTLVQAHEKTKESMVKEKDTAYDKTSGLKVKVVDNPGSKTPRPPFSDEEAFAMGTLAISLVGSSFNHPDAMLVFAHEYEGYTAGEVKYIMNNVTTEIPKALSVFRKMTDPLKKSYAAGFFAAIIKACGAAEDVEKVQGWHNCVEQFLNISGEVASSIEDGIKWYNRFDHGR